MRKHRGGFVQKSSPLFSSAALTPSEPGWSIPKAAIRSVLCRAGVHFMCVPFGPNLSFQPPAYGVGYFWALELSIALNSASHFSLGLCVSLRSASAFKSTASSSGNLK